MAVNIVAKIGDTNYDTLEEALNDAASSTEAVTIEVLKDTKLKSDFYSIKADLTITADDKVKIELTGSTDQALYFGEITAEDPTTTPYSKVTIGKNVAIDGAAYTISNWTPNATGKYGYADLDIEGDVNAAVVVWDSDVTIKGKVVDTLDRANFQGNKAEIIGDGTATSEAPQYESSALINYGGDLTIKDTVARFTSGKDSPYADNVLAATLNNTATASATLDNAELYFNDNVIYVGRNYNTVDDKDRVSTLTLTNESLIRGKKSAFIIGAETSVVTLENYSTISANSYTNNGTLVLDDSTIAFAGNEDTWVFENNGTIELKGWSAFGAEKYTLLNNGTINWDLNEGASKIVWNGGLDQNGKLTITVDADAKAGDYYTLASFADSAFGTTFTLVDGDDATLDPTITVGGADVEFGGMTYRLAVNEEDDTLELISLVNVSVTANSNSWMYDGDEHYEDGYEITEGAILEGDTLTASALTSFKHVSESGVNKQEYKVSRGTENVTRLYNFTKTDGTVTITKRDVTLTSASAVKQYDGEYLTAENVTVSGDGFVKGEEPDYFYKGEQLSVGSSKNEFGIRFYGDENDYTITQVYGDLTVLPQGSLDELVVAQDQQMTFVKGTEPAKFEKVTINKNGSLTLGEDAELTTETLTFKPDGEFYDYGDSVLDATNGSFTVKDIVVDSTNWGTAEIKGRVTLAEDATLTLSGHSYLTVGRDLYDDLIAKATIDATQGYIRVNKTADDDVVTVADVNTLRKLNTIGYVDFRDQDLVDLNKLAFAKNDELWGLVFRNATGTAKNDLISVAAGASIYNFGSYGGTTDLGVGNKDTVSVGSTGYFYMNGALANTEIIKVANGAVARDGTAVKTYFGCNGSVSGVSQFAMGNYTYTWVSGVVGTAYNDVISVGAYSYFASYGAIAFGAGADKFAIGGASQAYVYQLDDNIGWDVTGAITGVNAISVASAKKAELGSTLFAGDVTMVADRNNAITLGNYSKTTLGNVTMGAGKDKLSVGAYADFDAKSIAFGAGADQFAIGKYADVDVTGSVTDVEVITLGNYSDVTLADVTMSAGADKLVVGAYADFDAKSIDFGAGANKFTIGAASEVQVDKLVFADNFNKKGNFFAANAIAVGKNAVATLKADEDSAANIKSLTLDAGSKLYATSEVIEKITKSKTAAENVFDVGTFDDDFKHALEDAFDEVGYSKVYDGGVLFGKADELDFIDVSDIYGTIKLTDKDGEALTGVASLEAYSASGKLIEGWDSTNDSLYGVSAVAVKLDDSVTDYTQIDYKLTVTLDA